MSAGPSDAWWPLPAQHSFQPCLEIQLQGVSGIGFGAGQTCIRLLSSLPAQCPVLSGDWSLHLKMNGSACLELVRGLDGMRYRLAQCLVDRKCFANEPEGLIHSGL